MAKRNDDLKKSDKVCRKRKISNAIDISEDEETPTLTQPPRIPINFSFKPPEKRNEFEKFAETALAKKPESKRSCKERSKQTINAMANRLRSDIYIKEAVKLKNSAFFNKKVQKIFQNCADEGFHVSHHLKSQEAYILELEKENSELKKRNTELERDKQNTTDLLTLLKLNSPK